jgi:hypothetical protein
MRQSFYFLTESAVRLEFHILEDLGGITLDTMHNPPREPDKVRFDSADALADGMAERVKFHLEEHAARLTRIRFRHDPAPITYAHLGRYGAPIIPEDDGRRD